MIAPTIKQIALENKGRLRVVKIDIDKNKSIADRLSIKGVPTLAVFKNGELLWRQSGVMNKSQIMQAITKYL
ncbi:UNVERIFIED_CONTAM: hypothetical protein GTU68_027349 [Idotea baltica]|nr:hypothetical protein [Idotea baltica]